MTGSALLTRPLEKTLAGFFGGDWLGLVRYLGEQPHPDEEITAAIPQIKLYIGSSKTAAAIAAEKGLPAEEVKRMLSCYWDSGTTPQPDVTSPADQRVETMAGFWRHFDEAHARQAPGMPSLWGLVEEGSGVNIGWDEPEWYNPRLYCQVLPVELLRDIEQLWASIMLPRWPERIVSEISPHALMATTFGVALQFWHGCALTAWFLSEGPMSRTDIAGLPGYYQDAVAELQRLGCPVDPTLFDELKEAQALLGPPQPIKDTSSTVEIAPGISVEINTGSQSRRAGFEILRDIITRHRRAWAKQYLDAYFRARWQTEFREAARLRAQAIAERGKPPTARQFARYAVIPANHWLAGDMAALYAAIGEKSPIHPERVALMPADKHQFALLVFERLGGRPFKRKIIVGSREEALAQGAEQDRYTKLSWLAGQSLRLIQLEEAIGRAPELKEFGTSSFEYRSAVLAEDPQQAWGQYVTTVRAARSDYFRTPNSTTIIRS